MLQRLHTLQEVEQLVRVSISTLRRAVRSGELDHVRAGKRGQIRVTEEAVQTYLRRASGVPLTSAPSLAEEQTPYGASAQVAAADASAAATSNPPIQVREGFFTKGLTYRIINADVRVGLQSLPEASVDCAVTSPAYFWQRDYGYDGQLGHEQTVEEGVPNSLTALAQIKECSEHRTNLVPSAVKTHA
jgi:excisionase family DNA binding protein